jgi:F-type H+-transporting ATPase subunit b
MAALFAAVAALPFRVIALQPAAASKSVESSQAAPDTTASGAAQPSAVAQSGAAKSTEAPKPEQNENDVYLHAPVVRTIARMIHLDVETTARIFEGINFAIIVLAIGIPLFRWLPRFLRNRREKLRGDIESARKMTVDANARLSAIEAKLAGLDGEIAQIRAQVEEESKQDEARIKSTIGEESVRIVAAAEQEVEATAAQARRELRNFAADLAIEQAAKQLVFTPEADRALIAEFLSDVSLTGANGDGAHPGGQK